MLDASPTTLKILALLLWVTGVIILLTKASALLLEAYRLQPNDIWVSIAIIIGVLIGVLKAKFIFCKVCRKNLRRIDQLNQPKVWQFYRPGFYLFLSLMIMLGATLSRVAQGDYSLLIGVAVLDISIATALLGSSHLFWREWVQG